MVEKIVELNLASDDNFDGDYDNGRADQQW